MDGQDTPVWSLDPTALGLARAVITIQAPYTPSDERQLATAFCEEFKSQEPGLVLETAWGLIGDAESFSSAALAMYGPSSRQPSLETTIVALRLLGIHAFEHVIRTVWNNEGMAQEVRSLIKARVLELVENPAVAKMPPIPSRPGSRTAAVLASSTQAKPQAAGVHATLASHARIVASASVGLAVQLAVREWPQAWPELTHLMLSTSSELAVAAGGLTDALQQAEEQGAVSVDVAALFAQHFPGSIVTRVGSVCGIVTEIREKTSPNAGLGGGGGGSRGVGAGGGSASLFVPEQRRRDIHSGLMELKNVVFPGLVDAFSRLRAMQVPVERQLEQLRAAVAMGIGMTSPAAVSAAELCMGTLRSLTMRLLGAMLTLGELQTLTANADMGLLQQLWQGMACEETSDVCIDGIVDGLSHRPHDFGLASHIPQLIPVWRQLVLQMVVMTGTEVPIEVLLAIDGHDSLVGYGAGRGAGGQGQGGTQGGGGAGRGMGHMGSDPSSVSSMAGAGQGGYDPLAEFAWAAPANHAPESNLARVDRCLRLARVLLLTYPDVLSLKGGPAEEACTSALAATTLRVLLSIFTGAAASSSSASSANSGGPEFGSGARAGEGEGEDQGGSGYAVLGCVSLVAEAAALIASCLPLIMPMPSPSPASSAGVSAASAAAAVVAGKGSPILLSAPTPANPPPLRPLGGGGLFGGRAQQVHAEPVVAFVPFKTGVIHVVDRPVFTASALVGVENGTLDPAPFMQASYPCPRDALAHAADTVFMPTVFLPSRAGRARLALTLLDAGLAATVRRPYDEEREIDCDSEARFTDHSNRLRNACFSIFDAVARAEPVVALEALTCRVQEVLGGVKAVEDEISQAEESKQGGGQEGVGSEGGAAGVVIPVLGSPLPLRLNSAVVGHPVFPCLGALAAAFDTFCRALDSDHLAPIAAALQASQSLETSPLATAICGLISDALARLLQEEGAFREVSVYPSYLRLVTACAPVFTRARDMLDAVVGMYFRTMCLGSDTTGATSSSTTSAATSPPQRAACVTDIRRRACQGFVGVCKQYPTLVFVAYEDIAGKVASLQSVTDTEHSACVEALLALALSASIDSPEVAAFVSSVLSPVLSTLLTDETVGACLGGSADFACLLGGTEEEMAVFQQQLYALIAAPSHADPALAAAGGTAGSGGGGAGARARAPLAQSFPYHASIYANPASEAAAVAVVPNNSSFARTRHAVFSCLMQLQGVVKTLVRAAAVAAAMGGPPAHSRNCAGRNAGSTGVRAANGVVPSEGVESDGATSSIARPSTPSTAHDDLLLEAIGMMGISETDPLSSLSESGRTHGSLRVVDVQRSGRGAFGGGLRSAGGGSGGGGADSGAKGMGGSGESVHAGSRSHGGKGAGRGAASSSSSSSASPPTGAASPSSAGEVPGGLAGPLHSCLQQVYSVSAPTPAAGTGVAGGAGSGAGAGAAAITIISRLREFLRLLLATLYHPSFLAALPPRLHCIAAPGLAQLEPLLRFDAVAEALVSGGEGNGGGGGARGGEAFPESRAFHLGRDVGTWIDHVVESGAQLLGLATLAGPWMYDVDVAPNVSAWIDLFLSSLVLPGQTSAGSGREGAAAGTAAAAADGGAGQQPSAGVPPRRAASLFTRVLPPLLLRCPIPQQTAVVVPILDALLPALTAYLVNGWAAQSAAAALAAAVANAEGAAAAGGAEAEAAAAAATAAADAASRTSDPSFLTLLRQLRGPSLLPVPIASASPSPLDPRSAAGAAAETLSDALSTADVSQLSTLTQAAVGALGPLMQVSTSSQQEFEIVVPVGYSSPHSPSLHRLGAHALDGAGAAAAAAAAATGGGGMGMGLGMAGGVVTPACARVSPFPTPRIGGFVHTAVLHPQLRAQLVDFLLAMLYLPDARAVRSAVRTVRRVVIFMSHAAEVLSLEAQRLAQGIPLGCGGGCGGAFRARPLVSAASSFSWAESTSAPAAAAGPGAATSSAGGDGQGDHTCGCQGCPKVAALFHQHAMGQMHAANARAGIVDPQSHPHIYSRPQHQQQHQQQQQQQPESPYADAMLSHLTLFGPSHHAAIMRGVFNRIRLWRSFTLPPAGSDGGAGTPSAGNVCACGRGDPSCDCGYHAGPLDAEYVAGAAQATAQEMLAAQQSFLGALVHRFSVELRGAGAAAASAAGSAADHEHLLTELRYAVRDLLYFTRVDASVVDGVTPEHMASLASILSGDYSNPASVDGGAQSVDGSAAGASSSSASSAGGGCVGGGPVRSPASLAEMEARRLQALAHFAGAVAAAIGEAFEAGGGGGAGGGVGPFGGLVSPSAAAAAANAEARRATSVADLPLAFQRSLQSRKAKNERVDLSAFGGQVLGS